MRVFYKKIYGLFAGPKKSGHNNKVIVLPRWPWGGVPLYYGQFALSLSKESHYIFSYFSQLNMDTFYGPLSVHVKQVWLYVC